MGATYSLGGTGNRDRLRLRIGDTPPGGLAEFEPGVVPDFQDEELDDFLSQEGDDIDKAGAAALESLAARLARSPDFTADGASFKLQARVKEIRTHARLLRSRGRGVVTIMPQRKDGYSDDVTGDDVTGGSNTDLDELW